MKDIIQTIKENFKLVAVVLVAGLFLGWLFFHSGHDAVVPEQAIEGHEGHDHDAEESTIWTCSMHPQIKQDEPGLCPICAMDLIPLVTMQSSGDDTDPNEISMTESAIKLAEIHTTIVSTGIPHKASFLQGKVQVDERNIAELTARYGGRIEKLFVNFTGQQVKKGEKLATIYSPELVTAQRELLEAASFKGTRPALYEAAKGKLRLWDLIDEQISEIEAKGEPQLYFDILSPIAGTVMMRHVSLGDYVKEGSALFQVTDLSSLWVMFDAYESDLPWIKLGDRVDFNLQSIPGNSFSAKVTYIDPILDSKTRVSKVRVEVANSNRELKPEMFVNGTVESKIAYKNNPVLVPKSSVLWTGKRAVVYVKVPDRETPSFLYREIELGPDAGDNYIVASGLMEGEEIATNGVFKIDAAAQLQGLKSMMNPSEETMSTGHDHSGMDMSSATEERSQVEATTKTASEHGMFKVAGNCEMCKDRIETAALSVDGVLSAEWVAADQLVHLQFNPEKTSKKDIEQVIANVGHDTENYRANDETYDELPECCLYERLTY